MRRDTGQHCEPGLLRSVFDSSNVGSPFRVISQLQRHGARCPTTGLVKEIKKALKKIQPTIDFIFSSILMNWGERPSRYSAGQYVVDFQDSFVLKYSLHSRSYALGI